MHPFFVIFERVIPAYGLCGVIGLICSILFILIYTKHSRSDTEAYIYSFVLAVIVGMIGSKIMYLIVSMKSILAEIANGVDINTFVSRYISGGFVFYGGLILVIPFIFFIARYFSIDIDQMLNVMVPAALIFAAIGRIGCFCAGCCYGVETDLPIGIAFSKSYIAPNGIKLIPVQLIEAGFNFLLACLITACSRKKIVHDNVLEIYTISYSIFRFIIEFFRGDAERGFIGKISVSQFISCIVLVISICVFIKRNKGVKND